MALTVYLFEIVIDLSVEINRKEDTFTLVSSNSVRVDIFVSMK